MVGEKSHEMNEALLSLKRMTMKVELAVEGRHVSLRRSGWTTLLPFCACRRELLRVHRSSRQT